MVKKTVRKANFDMEFYPKSHLFRTRWTRFFAEMQLQHLKIGNKTIKIPFTITIGLEILFCA